MFDKVSLFFCSFVVAAGKDWKTEPAWGETLFVDLNPNRCISPHSTALRNPPLDRLNPPCNKRALERTASHLKACKHQVSPCILAPRLAAFRPQTNGWTKKNDRKLPGAADCLRVSPPHTLTGSDTHISTLSLTHTHAATTESNKGFQTQNSTPPFCVCVREGGPWLPWRCVSCWG